MLLSYWLQLTKRRKKGKIKYKFNKHLRGDLMNKFLHKYIIRFIAWYIRDVCGGASHVYPYGEQGRYIVIMNEDKYNKFTHL